MINSSLLSAQNRPRLYWTNIQYEMPKDKGIVLKDIMDPVDKETLVKKGSLYFDRALNEKEIALVDQVDGEIRISQATKQGYIIAEDGDGINLQFPTSKTRRGRVIKQKSSTLDCQCNICGFSDGVIRKLNIKELERLQTLTEGYTEGFDERISKKAIGNGWTVDVITHIFSFIEE